MTSPLEHRRLYLCTPAREDLAAFVAAAVRGGVDVVQLRDKTSEARQVLKEAAVVRAVCQDHGVPFILNDRPDLALYVGADGVHVGQEDPPPDLARTIMGPGAIVGLSTHGTDQLEGALGHPIDYLSAGPVEPTPTKPGRSGTGIRYASQAAARSPLPVFVTGGVRPETVPPLIEAGVRHFVVVRYLTEADDPQSAARRLRTVIDRHIDRAEGRG